MPGGVRMAELGARRGLVLTLPQSRAFQSGQEFRGRVREVVSAVWTGLERLQASGPQPVPGGVLFR